MKKIISTLILSCLFVLLVPNMVHALVSSTITSGFGDYYTKASALSEDGSVLYMYGYFPAFPDGYKTLAAVNATTGELITDWVPPSVSSVYSMAVKGNKLVIAGQFSGKIAIIDTTTGAMTDWTPTPALSQSIRTKIYVDDENVYAGTTGYSTVAYNITTGAWQWTAGGGRSSDLSVLEIDNDYVYVEAYQAIHRLHKATGERDMGWGIGHGSGHASSGAISGDYIYVGGTYYGGYRQPKWSLVRIHLETNARTFYRKDNKDPWAIEVIGDTIFIAGEWTNLTALDKDNPGSARWGAGGQKIYSILAGGTNLYAGSRRYKGLTLPADFSSADSSSIASIDTEDFASVNADNITATPDTAMAGLSKTQCQNLAEGARGAFKAGHIQNLPNTAICKELVYDLPTTAIEAIDRDQLSALLGDSIDLSTLSANQKQAFDPETILEIDNASTLSSWGVENLTPRQISALRSSLIGNANGAVSYAAKKFPNISGYKVFNTSGSRVDASGETNIQNRYETVIIKDDNDKCLMRTTVDADNPFTTSLNLSGVSTAGKALVNTTDTTSGEQKSLIKDLFIPITEEHTYVSVWNDAETLEDMSSTPADEIFSLVNIENGTVQRFERDAGFADSNCEETTRENAAYVIMPTDHSAGEGQTGASEFSNMLAFVTVVSLSLWLMHRKTSKMAYA